MQFNLAVTTAQGPYNFPFSIQASIPQPPASAFFDNFENGVNGWTTGGTGNAWAPDHVAVPQPNPLVGR